MDKTTYYVVLYRGHQAFIKPWTAVRDELTYSQQFLTPSIVEGIEKKLFPELLAQSGKIQRIRRHKISCDSISSQLEKAQSRAYVRKEVNGEKGKWRKTREYTIIVRGVLISPELYLAFDNESDAITASQQHICLCRNEDLLFPEAEIFTMTDEEFTTLKGFELIFDADKADSFMVGYNRFDANSPMYGRLEIDGQSLLGK